MRLVVIAIQFVLSFIITASVMPIVLVSVPAATQDHRIGLSLMAVLFVLSFVVIALLWPGKRRRPHP